MLGYSLSLCRSFAVKFTPLSQFTQSEKFLLEKVYLDDEIASYFKWKRYPINDQVEFEGEAQIINWENFRIGFGDLSVARDLALEHQVDLVLVRRETPVVRLMNYNNFILRWALKDVSLDMTGSRNAVSYVRVSHKIADRDLDIKVKRAFELVSDKRTAVIESDKIDEFNEIDHKLLNAFQKVLLKKLHSRNKENLSISVSKHEHLIRITLKSTGNSKNAMPNLDLDLNTKATPIQKVAVEVFEKVEFDDEEEFMNKLLEEPLETQEKPIPEEIFVNRNFDHMEDSEVSYAIKQKIKQILGEELASRFLKGRFKGII